MPYKFTFDLSNIPRFFFAEIAKTSYQKGVHRKMSKRALEIIKKFRIQELTGLNVSEAIVLLEDLMDLYARNLLEREKFAQTKRRALFLPHCSRKYMDGRCRAIFDASIPSYVCAHCSPDCLVNEATSLAVKKGYDVFVVPGGSCVPKILKTKGYEGIVGVACGEEVRMSGEVLGSMDVAAQGIPLIKNGCANTAFNIETLLKTL